MEPAMKPHDEEAKAVLNGKKHVITYMWYDGPILSRVQTPNGKNFLCFNMDWERQSDGSAIGREYFVEISPDEVVQFDESKTPMEVFIKRSMNVIVVEEKVRDRKVYDSVYAKYFGQEFAHIFAEFMPGKNAIFDVDPEHRGRTLDDPTQDNAES